MLCKNGVTIRFFRVNLSQPFYSIKCSMFQIDLDTIDVSNLNRQFLFQRQHVGKSKAKVACEAALGFNPLVSLKAHHDSVMR